MYYSFTAQMIKKNQLNASEETEAEICPFIICQVYYLVVSLAFLSLISMSFNLPCFSSVLFFLIFPPEPMILSVSGLIPKLDYLPSSSLGREQSDSFLASEDATTCDFSDTVPIHFLSLYNPSLYYSHLLLVRAKYVMLTSYATAVSCGNL